MRDNRRSPEAPRREISDLGARPGLLERCSSPPLLAGCGGSGDTLEQEARQAPAPSDAPPIAMGNLLQATSQALANAAHNATSQQQASNVAIQSATQAGVATLNGLDSASTGVPLP